MKLVHVEPTHKRSGPMFADGGVRTVCYDVYPEESVEAGRRFRDARIHFHIPIGVAARLLCVDLTDLIGLELGWRRIEPPEAEAAAIDTMMHYAKERDPWV